MNLMTSFCNGALGSLTLGHYDVERGRFRWIDLGKQQDTPILSTTGLCFGEDRFWCVRPGAREARLLTFDQRFTLTRVDTVPGVWDAHSLARFEDGLLINDTGKNALVQIWWQGERIEQRTIWQDPVEEVDRVHVNSVTAYRGAAVVSMIGPKPADGWWHAHDGQILNITTGEVICQDLAHPHSLLVFDDVLYWVESRAKKVHAFSPERGHRVVADLAELPGYPRGLAMDERFFYVGASARRRHSKSTGLALPPVALTYAEASSWLYRIDRETQTVDRWNFAALGEEFYDLAAVPPGFEAPGAAEADPAVERIWRLIDELRQARLGIQAAHVSAAEGIRQTVLDLERTSRWARELEAECVRREAWAHELETALGESREHACQTEAALSGVTRWARDLEAECQRRGSRARELEAALRESADRERQLEAALNEAATWARQLEAECKRRGAVIEELQDAAG